MLWNLKEGSVAVGDSEIDYAAFGKGEKNLVIIPGLTLRDVKGAGASLALMYRIFADDYRVYILDKKNDISEGCTVADLAEDTVAAMRALGIERASVFGVSLGGMIAEEIAIRYPALVDKLVLGVTASRVNDTMREAVGKWIEFAEAGDFSGIVRDMLTSVYSEKYAKRYGRLLPILSRFAKPKNEERFIRLAKASLTCNSYDRLDRIEALTLVLGGKEDKVVTAEASYEMAQMLDSEIYMYDGLGHSAYEEAKDFNLRIYEFLKNE